MILDTLNSSEEFSVFLIMNVAKRCNNPDGNISFKTRDYLIYVWLVKTIEGDEIW